MNQPLPYQVPLLPHGRNMETPQVLRQLVEAHRHLAELKGVTTSIPNERILMDTLSLQEAKDSSAIENIITTHDELYRSDDLNQQYPTAAAKEVHRYVAALKHGFQRVREQGGLGVRLMEEVQAIVENSHAGLRKVPGTTLKNDQTGAVVYVPPQGHDQILALLRNLEVFLNQESSGHVDPLVKMAIAHHQFESIHPFYDGNGRTGRIVNALYLVSTGLLDLPVLYLSRYIIRNKQAYYRLLQETRSTNDWEPWLLYILNGVSVTAKDTVLLIKAIKELMQVTKLRIRGEQPRMYSQDLINSLFRHPYTKIAFMERDLGVSRITATRYLGILSDMGILTKLKAGRTNFYLNEALFGLLRDGPARD